MIDTKKVGMMTRIAIYEQGTGKEDRKIYRYGKRRYVEFRMMVSFFSITIAYILIAGLYCFRFIDEIFSEGFGYDYKTMILYLVTIYLIVVLSGLAVTFYRSSKRYKRALERLIRYDHDLYDLDKYLRSL